MVRSAVPFRCRYCRRTVTSNGYSSGDTGAMNGDRHDPGWWVGSDGNWHSPDEDFDSDVPKKDHPIRRVAIVILAVAVVGATTFGVWLGGSQTSGPSTAGPPLAEITSQVRQAVTGTGANQFGVAGVSSVVCSPPSSWNPGDTFKCHLYASSQRELGVYDGTVQSTTSSGEWRWNGVWKPNHRSSSTV